ncbi:MAG: polysaccharide biosynthesis tyrosine autokinase [Syntrophales bacterium]
MDKPKKWLSSIRKTSSSDVKKQDQAANGALASSIIMDQKEKDKKRAGWVSPTYSQSKTIRLKPEVILANRCIAYLTRTPETEAYRVLRTRITQLIKARGDAGNTILVTSALPGEGKTLTAINLAFTFARDFMHTVLLVDADLRKQSIHEHLGYAKDKGLVDYLVDGCPISDLICWPGVEKLSLISGGRSITESAELLGSPRMKELVSDLKNRYPERFIIFDSSPVLAGADVQAFVPLVDYILFVVQAGKTSMEDVDHALQFLPQEKILGFVLNRAETVLSSYYKSYYTYSYGDR